MAESDQDTSIYAEPKWVDPQAIDEPKQVEPAKKKSGCFGCLLGCLGVAAVFVVACGLGTWAVARNWPGWTRDVLVSAVDESELSADDKRDVTEQIHRVFDEYEAGNIELKQLVGVIEELVESPLFVLALAYTANEKYVQPSGLSDEEKLRGRLQLDRVARGVFEQTIDADDLDTALDYISTKDLNGNRQFKTDVSDDDVRAMLAECKRLADQAEVPAEPYQVDIGAEFQNAVDKALAEHSDGNLGDGNLGDGELRRRGTSSTGNSVDSELIQQYVGGKRTSPPRR